MKKNLLAFILALMLLTVSFAAAAEGTEPERIRGNYPERGISLAMTEEDEAMGLGCAFTMGGTAEVPQLPLFQINYSDMPSLEAVIAEYRQYDNAAFNDEAFVYQFMTDMYSCIYPLYQIALFDAEYVSEKAAGDGVLTAGLTLSDVTLLAENDGYAYILMDNLAYLTFEDEALQERVLAAAARAKALIDAITFQPVVFAEGEVTRSPDAFPAFETLTLTGSTVGNELFSGKDLTVVNIWGTFCGPCINEMPELAAWSKEMPENVQLVGLVSDLYSADDAETLETALAICEATGADAYTHLIANEDFLDLLSGVIGVPTTLFVDGQGKLVAEPVVGANVPLCRKIAEDYLSAL